MNRSYSTSIACMLCIIIIFSTHFLIHSASASSSAFECTPGYGCYYRYKDAEDDNMYYTRKMLMDLKVSSSKTQYVHGGGKMNDEVEMRNVPAGPDPMHHNSGPQKKPKISIP